MLLYRCAAPPLAHIVSEGPRYLVPRDDGHVLVGSTEEDVGFDKRTTEAALAELRDFAESLVPMLANAELVASWAGLRPHAVDGFPYIGRVPHLENCFLAAGHYRAGLSTSPGTALLLRQLIAGEPLAIDIAEFRLDR
jgi:glycine oxidase